jgi:hypothetical protein
MLLLNVSRIENLCHIEILRARETTEGYYLSCLKLKCIGSLYPVPTPLPFPMPFYVN